MKPAKRALSVWDFSDKNMLFNVCISVHLHIYRGVCMCILLSCSSRSLQQLFISLWDLGLSNLKYKAVCEQQVVGKWLCKGEG